MRVPQKAQVAKRSQSKVNQRNSDCTHNQALILRISRKQAMHSELSVEQAIACTAAET